MLTGGKDQMGGEPGLLGISNNAKGFGKSQTSVLNNLSQGC